MWSMGCAMEKICKTQRSLAFGQGVACNVPIYIYSNDLFYVYPKLPSENVKHQPLPYAKQKLSNN